MAVKGVFASDSHITSNRKGSFASALLHLQPTGSAQLLALSSGMQSDDIRSTIDTWFEENHISGRVEITNNAGTGTSFEVDDASTITVGNTYMVESTGEFVYVDSITGTTVTVTRGFAGTTAQSIDGSGTAVGLQRISSAMPEGSDRPTAVANLGYPRFNYVQIFRNAWDVTGTARRVEYHTGDLVAKNRRDASMLHAEDIERALIWGRKHIGVKDSQPFRLMDGINSQISTNVTAQSTNTKWTDLVAFFQDVFSRNIKGQPNERIAYCGNTVLSVLSELARINSQITIQPGETEFGLQVHRIITPFGKVSLMTHPLMNESPLWTKDMYVYHPASVRMKYLRRTHEDPYDKDGTRAGRDGDFGVFTTECTVVYKGEVTGGIYTGIDTAAAEA